MRSEIFKHACRAWRGVLQRSWFALCMTAVLPALSCRSIKEDTSIQVADSLRWDRKVSVTLATTPFPPVRLTTPLDSLRKLPAGAVYTHSSGSLRVTASLEGDSLRVTAEAEGLPRLEYQEEESLEHVRNEQSESETVKGPVVVPFWGRLKQGLSDILIAFILAIIFKRYKQWQKIRKQDPSV